MSSYPYKPLKYFTYIDDVNDFTDRCSVLGISEDGNEYNNDIDVILKKLKEYMDDFISFIKEDGENFWRAFLKKEIGV